jgi:hypothetical protein
VVGVVIEVSVARQAESSVKLRLDAEGERHRARALLPPGARLGQSPAGRPDGNVRERQFDVVIGQFEAMPRDSCIKVSHLDPRWRPIRGRLSKDAVGRAPDDVGMS